MGSALAVAVAIGVGVAVQVSILGQSAVRAHPLSVSLALQVSGVMVGALWATVRRAWPAAVGVTGEWWWIPLGVLGWLLVAALGFAAMRLGVAATLGVAVSAQLAVGLLLDARSGLTEITLRPVLGAVLLVSGVILITART